MVNFFFGFFQKSKDKKDFLKKHILSVIIFTILYLLANRLAIYHGIEDEKIKPFDTFHFSLVTQTTVGYGKNFTTNLYTQIINVLHLLTIYGVFIIDIF